MINKVKKHLSILQNRLNRGETVAAMRSTGNPTLLKVVDSLLKVDKDDFTPTDRAAFARVEAHRKRLLASNEVVDYRVFGSNNTELIKNVCAKATSPATWARLIYTLAKELPAKKVLEIGTNLGVSGSYLLEAMRSTEGSHLVTMDGMPRYVEISREAFLTIVPEARFETIVGRYEDTFDAMVARHEGFDLLFIDGNHQRDPTVEYFLKLLSRATRPSLWVFDDIYWTTGMEDAWRTIRHHPQTAYSIDMYKQGIVVVDPAVTEPRHFKFHLAY